MDQIRVLIAEDEPAVRAALADLVESDPGMNVVGIAGDADQAIEVAKDQRPDVALVDVKMPAGGGVRATKEILRASPQTHVVALSAYEDRRTVLEMLRAGVVGYMVKGTPAEEILYTIRRSMHGQGSLSVEVTADVIHELTDLLERSEGLARELQELNRTKSELIQILSHELFTPITTIQGFALTVAEHGDEMSNEDLQDLLHGVTRAGNRIKRLIGNLAAAARLDREGVEVSTRPVQVSEILDRASSEFGEAAERIEMPAQAFADAKIWADVGLGTRALVVLLENALALSPPEESIVIQLDAHDGELRVSVLDRGPGIPDDLREQIFGAFTQADSSTTRSHEGLGIGLYLARRIMRAHGGSIDVEPHEGGGSIFRLSFPALDGAAS
ncbi:MAG: ATP-binding protein [Actinomycetota bacterium]